MQATCEGNLGAENKERCHDRTEQGKSNLPQREVDAGGRFGKHGTLVVVFLVDNHLIKVHER